MRNHVVDLVSRHLASFATIVLAVAVSDSQWRQNLAAKITDKDLAVQSSERKSKMMRTSMQNQREGGSFVTKATGRYLVGV